MPMTTGSLQVKPSWLLHPMKWRGEIQLSPNRKMQYRGEEWVFIFKRLRGHHTQWRVLKIKTFYFKKILDSVTFLSIPCRG